jgi:hypothetical protein
MKRRRPWFLAFLLVSPGIWLLKLLLHPGGVPFYRGAEYTDLLISHLPFSTFVHRAVDEWGHVPLWNPLILSGAPLAADPLAGLWYPPIWFTFLLPSLTAFQVVLSIHMIGAGVGMFLFLRDEGLGAEAALLGGLSFSGAPKIVAHVGLGHIGLVSALSWTPWVLICIRRLMQDVHLNRIRLARCALAGGCLGILFIADPRWSLPAGLLALLYGLRFELAAGSKGKRERWWPRRRALLALTLVVLFSLCVSACLSLPLLEFIQNSTRVGLERSERSVYALPVTQILGFILPIFNQGEWVVYLGTPLILLAMIALLAKSEGSIFWASLGLTAIILALGDGTPLYPILTAVIPGFNLLRVPARWVLLTVICVSILAGQGLDLLVQGVKRPRTKRTIRMSALGLTLFTVALTFSLWLTADIIAPALAISAMLSSSAAAALTFLHTRASRRGAFVVAAWLLLVVIDLAFVDAHLLDVRSFEGTEPNREAVARRLAAEPGIRRIFSPSYSIPQHLAARIGLELADGVNPLQIDRYSDFMARAVGFEEGDYSVTLPPFPSGNPRQPQQFRLDPQQLGLANVQYVVSDYPIEVVGLSAIDHREGIYLYQNDYARTRAWVEVESRAGAAVGRQAEVTAWSPNAIQIEARGPGRLVVSEVSYPGWVATLDGRATNLVDAHSAFRALDMKDGSHQIELVFRPVSVKIGAVITLLTLIALGGLWLRR